MITDTIDADIDIRTRQYRTRFTSVSHKDFVGQLHGVDLPGTPWEINADNRSEFMQELWVKLNHIYVVVSTFPATQLVSWTAPGWMNIL